jgi:thiosulfate reductase cytochrome b subunit
MYARFERFWHWSQAALIILMLITGFEIHGSYQLLGFEQAVSVHGVAAWVLIGLWVFAWFWHLTTGEWKQYIPDAPKRILAMMRFYAFEIFQGKAHPFHKDREHKLNPLQRMAYLSLHIAIGPAIWISGLLYLFYGEWTSMGLFGGLTLGIVALIHTAAAFLMLAFLVAHLYLALTMDERPLSSLHAMITGYEKDDD